MIMQRSRIRGQVNWLIFVDVFMTLFLIALVASEESIVKSVSELLKTSKVHIELSIQNGEEIITCHGRKISTSDLKKIIQKAFKEGKRTVRVVAITEGKMNFSFFFSVRMAALSVPWLTQQKVIWDCAEATYYKKS